MIDEVLPGGNGVGDRRGQRCVELVLKLRDAQPGGIDTAEIPRIVDHVHIAKTGDVINRRREMGVVKIDIIATCIFWDLHWDNLCRRRNAFHTGTISDSCDDTGHRSPMRGRVWIGGDRLLRHRTDIEPQRRQDLTGKIGVAGIDTGIEDGDDLVLTQNAVVDDGHKGIDRP